MNETLRSVHKWCGETAGGNEIEMIKSDRRFGFVGFVNDNGCLCAINWDSDGLARDLTTGNLMGLEWDLVANEE